MTEGGGLGAHRRLPVLLVLLVVLALAPFLPAILGGGVLVYRDHLAHFLPKRWLLSRALDGDASLLWNPYVSAGVPFLADPESGVFYPPAVLLFGLLPFRFAFDLFPPLHVAWIGLGTYLLLRRNGLEPAPAALGGLVVEWCGFAFSVSDLANTLASWSWIPWALLCARAAAGESGLRRRWAGLTGLCLALSFAAGDPAIALATALLCAATAARSAAGGGRTRREAVRAAAVSISWMAVAAAGLAAVQAVPFLEWALRTRRAEGIPIELATERSLQLPDLLGFFAPLPFAGPGWTRWARTQDFLASLYAGWVPLFAVAWLEARRWRRSLPWAGLAVIGVLLALGKNLPGYGLLYASGLDVVRYPARFLFLSFPAFAVLAALGFSALLERVRGGARLPPARALAPAAGAASMAAFFLLVPLGWPRQVVLGLAGGLARGAVLAGAAGGLALAASRRRLGETSLAGLVLLLAIADLGFYGRPGFDTAPLSSLLAPPVTVAGLRGVSGAPPRVYCAVPLAIRESYAARGDPPPLGHARRSLAFLPSGGSLLYGIAEVGRDPVLPVLSYEPVEKALAGGDGREWERFLGVQLRTDLVRGASGPRLSYRRVRADPSPLRLLDPTGDLAGRPLLDPATAGAVAFGRGAESCPGTSRSDLLEWHSSGLTARVRASCPTLLVHTSDAMPGWRVRLDGQPAGLVPVLGTFQGVIVPPGEHEVRFLYRPRSLVVGAGVSALTLLLLGGAAAARRFTEGGRSAAGRRSGRV